MNGDFKPKAFGDLLKSMQKDAARAKRRSGKRDKAAAAFREAFPDLADRVSVASVKTGVVTLETNSAALLQELESFHRHAIQEKLRTAGLPVSEVRARLRP